MTQLQFYSYKLAVRPDGFHFSSIHLSNKLFHQYLVDLYIKIEANRLNYIRTNQQKLHVESYQGLFDYINQADLIGPVGRVTILPSSFTVIIFNKLIFVIKFELNHTFCFRVVVVICNKTFRMRWQS
jgi:hypothetical protein